MARVVPRALIVLVGIAACAAVIGAALLVSDWREPGPQRVDIGLAPPTAPVPAASQQLEDAGAAQRFEIPQSGEGSPDASEMEFFDASFELGPIQPVSAWSRGQIDVRVVREEDGAPIVGARVTLLAVGVESWVPVDRSTGDSGSVRFEGLGSGDWILSVSAGDRLSRRDIAYIGESDPTAAIDFKLVRQRTLSVRLVDDAGREYSPIDFDRMFGTPVGVVAARECGPVGSMIDHHGIARGTARAPDSARGAPRWQLVVEGTGASCVMVLLGSAILGTAPIDPAAADVEVRMAGAVIRDALAPLVVRVLSEADGMPVRRALVTSDATSQGRRVQGLTDDDGCVRFDGPIEGGTGFTVSARGFGTARRALSRPIGAQVSVSLARGRRIEGVVQDEHGNPSPRTDVALYAVELVEGALAQDAPVLARTSRNGAFSFADLAAGRYAVGVRGGSTQVAIPNDCVRVDCRAGDVLDLRLEIPVAKSSAPSRPR